MKWAVIFDMDGVLVDSADAHFQSWQKLAAERGKTFNAETFARTFGRTSRSILLEEFDSTLTDDELTRLDGRKEEHYRSIIAESFPAMPGATELIDELSAAGAALAVGSSGPPENVTLVLERLQRRRAFDAVVTGLDVTRGKPDPQVFQIAAAKLDIPPRRCVVIEDAPAGIKAALAAGMRCVALVSSGRDEAELHRADRIVTSLHVISAAEMTSMLGD